MANAVNTAANRALASAASCRKLDIALAERAEAQARSRAADNAVMAARREAVKCAAALRSAARMLAECNRAVTHEAALARAAAVKRQGQRPTAPVEG